MTRAPLAYLTIVALTAAACLASWVLHADPEHARPPHGERLTGVTQELPGVDLEAAGAELNEWIQGERRAEWIAGVEAAERAEAARVADLAAQQRAGSAVPRVVGAPASPSGDCAAIAAEFGVPASVVERESHCSRDPGLLNPTGCVEHGVAWGCVGPVQLHLGHFANPSPWGGVGVCWGLDAYSYADQVACAHRLGPSAWGG